MSQATTAVSTEVSTGDAKKTKAKGLASLYRYLRGGFESDIVLRAWLKYSFASYRLRLWLWLSSFSARHFVHWLKQFPRRRGLSLTGLRVLDTGVGDGGSTRLMTEQEPEVVYFTDYVGKVAKAAYEKLGGESRPAWKHQPLDLAGDVSAELSGRQFDFIGCFSVLMHLTPEKSAAAVEKCCKLLAPGGRLDIVLISEEAAEQCYIRAHQQGEYAYYPAMSCLDEQTEAAVLAHERAGDMQALLEYYPPRHNYIGAVPAGFEVETDSIYADGSCLLDRRGRPSVYASFAKAHAADPRKGAIWKVISITRPRTEAVRARAPRRAEQYGSFRRRGASA